ncbi:alpha/beta hydrolase [Parachryseolinea silvisoli]|uniref:alpha/beta hydrolase n=1 Tax=Parachryseolinea silvisoli TaxID=2873601 RepID=UPI002265DA17|nr:dienelactone hydrolase family protein [Parachryseolinea silvisoli]MCD9017027.1 dienelactone hydrolase family protein [Parachryseolinea silvisoli]
MHQKNIQYAGLPLAEAKRALILLHGRGGTASDILSLSPLLHVQDFALLAPQATQQTWYPYSFLAPPADNEPWLSSALSLIGSVVEDITAAGITAENIYFTGFSQGACLTLEFITRHAQRWGGVAAFTGGLIGDKLYPVNYHGDFGGTPVFIGTSDPDPHVPVTRVLASEATLRERHAHVTVKVYPNMGHTISRDELEQANTLIFKA